MNGSPSGSRLHRPPPCRKQNLAPKGATAGAQHPLPSITQQAITEKERRRPGPTLGQNSPRRARLRLARDRVAAKSTPYLAALGRLTRRSRRHRGHRRRRRIQQKQKNRRRHAPLGFALRARENPQSKLTRWPRRLTSVFGLRLVCR